MEYKGIRLPEGLTGDSLYFMEDILDNLEKDGNLSRLDKLALYMLAGNIQMYLKCENIVRNEGMTVTSAQGNTNLSPYVTQMKYLWGQISDMLKQMGLTLASRTRLKLPEEEGKEDILKDLMNN